MVIVESPGIATTPLGGLSVDEVVANTGVAVPTPNPNKMRTTDTVPIDNFLETLRILEPDRFVTSLTTNPLSDDRWINGPRNDT